VTGPEEVPPLRDRVAERMVNTILRRIASKDYADLVAGSCQLGMRVGAATINLDRFMRVEAILAEADAERGT
jgi:hypothetical protein